MFYKIKRIINEKGASITGTNIEHSDYGMKNIPYLLQVSGVENTDAYLTADASKFNKDDDDMKISEKEEQKNVEYQETLKIDVVRYRQIHSGNMESNI